MAGTISFGGIGSGIDTESIVNGLVQASQQPISKLKSRASSTRAAMSTISDLSSLFSTLQKSVKALEDSDGVASFKASSSSSAIVATTKGAATPGSFDITVKALAQEFRSYSSPFAASDSELGQTGTLDIQVGSGDTFNIDVESTDTLDDIAAKINASDARVTASVIFDGDTYQLQVRGKDTGKANDVTLTENGTALGFTTYQAADDAKIEIDGIEITRGTNQFTGVIPGVTLAVTEKTTDPVKINIETDPDGLKSKLDDVVNAYNAVVNKVHQAAGFGTQTATNPVLAGDSTLRTVLGRLTSSLGSLVGSGKYQTASSVGLSSNSDGTLKLDTLALEKALDDDPDAVSQLLSGDSESDGIMDLMRDVVDSFIEPTNGLLDLKKQNLESRAEGFDDRIDREQERLDRYADMLRKQFTQMDTAVAGYNAQLDYLVRLYNSG